MEYTQAPCIPYGMVGGYIPRDTGKQEHGERALLEARIEALVAVRAHKERVDREARENPGSGGARRAVERACDEARSTLTGQLDQIFEPQRLSREPMPCVTAREEHVGAVESQVWRRCVEIRFRVRGVLYTFTADACALAGVDYDTVRSPSFAPLSGPPLVSPGTGEPASEELTKAAVEVCRAVAERLGSFAIDSVMVTQSWPQGRPSFAEIVHAKRERRMTERGAPPAKSKPYPFHHSRKWSDD